MAKPDLNKLKEEISKRKNETISKEYGTDNSINNSPRDTFLYGLLESLNTGKETKSSSLVKTVANTAAEKNNENVKLKIDEVHTVSTQKDTITNHDNSVAASMERDEQLWRDLENKKKQTLAEQISSFTNTQKQTPNQHNVQNPQGQLNENYLTESVKKIIDGYLVENFASVVEETIKSTILEMYALERINEVLISNKEMIKSLIYETIKEIQVKNKAKNAQQ